MNTCETETVNGIYFLYTVTPFQEEGSLWYVYLCTDLNCQGSHESDCNVKTETE